MRGKNMSFSHKQRVARLRGEAAFLSGKDLDDNPYNMEKLRFAWVGSYMAARRVANPSTCPWCRDKAPGVGIDPDNLKRHFDECPRRPL